MMTNLNFINKLFDLAKSNGYVGDAPNYEIGKFMDGTNYYSIIFKKDFATSIWGKLSIHHLQQMSISDDKWEYLKNNVVF